MKRLYLLRHGQTMANIHHVYNPEDDALTPEGTQQALAAGPYVQGLRVDAVFCSPLARARETARLLGVHATPEPALADHKFGVFSGRPWGSLRAEAQKHGMSREDYAPEGGESLLDARERVVAFIRNLPDGSYLLIAHAGTIIDLVHSLTGRAWSGLHVENVALWVIEDGHVLQQNWKPWLEGKN